MQTIQDTIRYFDPESIEHAYFYAHPIKLHEISNHEHMSIGDFKKLVSNRFQEFLKRLCDMKVTPNSSILFAYKSQEEGDLFGLSVGLIHSEELLHQDMLSNVPTYAYEFTEQQEALGFLVADNKLTQDNLMDVVVSFLYEISFYGFEQEYLEEELTKLDKAIKECNEHPERQKTFDFDDFRDKLGMPKEEEYPDEAEKLNICHNACHEYTNYCRNIELMRIKEQLICSG